MRAWRSFPLLQDRRPILVVPPEFNRNSSTVISLMSPEDSGCWLLDRMRKQIGLESYANKRLLDFGCGVRFSQAIINRKLSIGDYIGVDVCLPMIEFLQKKVRDDRFSYIFLDAYHAMYNPHGSPLTPNWSLPITQDADVVCMFSVITHQYPNDSLSIFSILRRHINAAGQLFFTCFLDESIFDFEDRSPERNGGRCFYNPQFLTDIVQRCGWRVVTRARGEGPLIGDSFVLQPDRASPPHRESYR